MKKGSVYCNGKKWTVILDDNGEVWFHDETRAKMNVGQKGRVTSIEHAEEVAKIMLRSLGYCRDE